MNMDRDFDSPQYKAWRAAVYKRDGKRCKAPFCNHKTKGLNAHHIKRWADCPTLRFDVSNGITLCRACHKKIQGKEEEYEDLFRSLISMSKLTLLFLKMRYGDVDPT